MIYSQQDEPVESARPVVYMAEEPKQHGVALAFGRMRPFLLRVAAPLVVVACIVGLAVYVFHTYNLRSQIRSASDMRSRLVQCRDTNVVVAVQASRPKSNTALSDCTYALETMLNYYSKSSPGYEVKVDGWYTALDAEKVKDYKQKRMSVTGSAVIDVATYSDMIAYLDGDISRLSSEAGVDPATSTTSSSTPSVAASSPSTSSSANGSASSGASANTSTSASGGSSASTPASSTAPTTGSSGGTTAPSSPPSSGGTPAPSGGKPSAANTGVPAGHALTVPTTNSSKGISVASNGNVTISKAGTFENMLIKGRLTIKADSVTIRYSRVEATPSPYDLPDDPTSAAACSALGSVSGQQAISVFGRTNVLIEDSEIIASRKSIFLANGIHGSGYTMRRVEISGTVDGAGAFGTSGAAANVVIQDSYIHDLYVGAYDYGHSCGPSHSDGLQIHYGSNFTVTNNTISPNSITTQKSNAAIMVNENGSYKTSNVTITGNWLDYGACSLNIARGSGSSGITKLNASSNKFGKHQSATSGGQPCVIVADNLTKALGGNDFSANTWEDGSSPTPKLTNAGW